MQFGSITKRPDSVMTRHAIQILLACLLSLPLVAAADLPAWPDPVAHHVSPYHTSGLTHGPLLGRPTATSMRVWVRTGEPMPMSGWWTNS